MPRGFNEEEKKRITGQLYRCGKELFTRYGVRKTSIDDIVKCAGIAKGSFYQFFPSKEILFFSIVDRFQQDTRDRLRETFSQQQDLSVEGMTEVLLQEFRILREEPLLRILLDQEEYQAIYLKLPQEVLDAERDSDVDYAGELYRLWLQRGLHPRIELTLFTDLIRVVVLGALQSNLVQSDYFEMVRIMIKGILLQTFPEGVR